MITFVSEIEESIFIRLISVFPSSYDSLLKKCEGFNQTFFSLTFQNIFNKYYSFRILGILDFLMNYFKISFSNIKTLPCLEEISQYSSMVAITLCFFYIFLNTTEKSISRQKTVKALEIQLIFDLLGSQCSSKMMDSYICICIFLKRRAFSATPHCLLIFFFFVFSRIFSFLYSVFCLHRTSACCFCIVLYLFTPAYTL